MDRTCKIIFSCTVASVGAYTLYQYWKRNRVTYKDCQAQDEKCTKAIISELRNFDKANLSVELASFIVNSLENVDVDARIGYMKLLHQASSFSSNYSVFKRSHCLEKMLALLSTTDTSLEVTRQNLIILQIATNLSCDPNHIEAIQGHLNTILSLANVKLYSDQACAALQFLCNLTLLPDGCRTLYHHCNVILSMLITRDIHMLRQIFSVLINLSCDDGSRVILLDTQVPDGLIPVLRYCLSSSMKPIVILQTLHLLKNLYSKLDEEYHASDTLNSLLYASRFEIRMCLSLLLYELTSSEAWAEITKEAKALDDLLQGSDYPDQREVN